MKRLFSYSFVVLLGLSFVIPISSSLSAGTLKVTTPNGGNKWKTGKKYAIKWVKGNGGAFVKIQLLKSNKHYKWVSNKTKNDGKHPWKVPASVATGSAYKIKITSIKNKKVFDKSNRNFSITKSSNKKKSNKQKPLKITTPNAGQIPTTVVAGSAYKIKITAKTKSSITDSSDKNFTISKSGGGGSGSLKVTVPNGDETWKPNTVHVIKWDKGDAGKFVRIFLLKHTGKRYKTVSLKTKNDGKYPWQVPASVAAGDYKIRVQAVTDNTLNDDSDKKFKIGDCTRFDPTGGWTALNWYPGEKFLVADLSKPSVKDWLHVSCPYTLYYLLSDGWYYIIDDGFYFTPTNGKLCTGFRQKPGHYRPDTRHQTEARFSRSVRGG